MPPKVPSFLRAFWIANLSLKTERARVYSAEVLDPNSEGMKRLTWALAADLTSRSYVAIRGSGKGRDHIDLALESASERFEGVEVNGYGGHGGVKAVSAALRS